ncbi:MAG: DUF502 domain-containing protein [Akkermansiaceae bacterium]|nr:DUF502 domain-containing protein [Akkermansiaceae bacterium]NNM30449.1 DUF502 domain-containing protein [Akkermansiaceae bacterium]
MKHPLIRRWFSRLLAGLAAVIPIVGTVWVLYLVYKILFRVGEKIIYWIFRLLNVLRGVEPGAVVAEGPEGRPVVVGPDGEPLANQTHPWTFEFFGDDVVWFLIPVMLLLLAGFAVTNRPGRAVLNWVDRAITRVPILGFVYAALKQFVDALRNLGGPRKFKGVAYIEYPSEGCRLLGFVTGNFHDPQAGKDVTSVFIPTSPNPMTGFIIIVDDDKVFDSEMSLEEASKMILSAGLVSPESYEASLR